VELNEREVETSERAVTNDGRTVQERTRRVETEGTPMSTLMNLIWFIYGVVAILLAGRFILKLTGANGTTGFVSFVYAITGWLSRPFDAVFGVTSASTSTFTSIFEPSILVAIVVYGLIAWGIAKLLTINRPRRTAA
jgi:hypothetical protein